MSAKVCRLESRMGARRLRMANQQALENSFRFSGFDQLMPFRIRDILLVSSLYDSFTVEQDGRLTELLLSEYTQLNLNYAPLITRVSTGEEALAILKDRRFDLVITMTNLGNMEVAEFGVRVKNLNLSVPIVVLVHNTRELTILQEKLVESHIDRIFAWRGDSRILLAIVKLIEDQVNARPDTENGSVRCLLLIENSTRFYSTYLPIIYTAVLRQTQNLMADGIDVEDKLLRMRARPKILLAEDYEEAEFLYSVYKKYMLGVITDARFNRGGEPDPRAGLEFIRMVKRERPEMPILLQSSGEELVDEAKGLGADFLHKESPTLLNDLRGFMKAKLGFGEFIFSTPDGEEVGRANDLVTMTRLLREVPGESLVHHAQHNQFSNWFMARTEFELALRIRPVKASDFDDPEELREYLLESLNDYRDTQQRGRVADFSRQHYDRSVNFARIGDGSLGGKGRGLAFINVLLDRDDIRKRYPDVKLFVPPSVVLATGVFDAFMEENDLLWTTLRDCSDEEISGIFISARLPEPVVDDLRVFLNEVEYPLAVRSSSLLENSQHQPFAGVYESHMIPNNHADPEFRLEQLCHAVKLVYASTYFKAAKAYFRATPNRIEEEKMAVIIQQLVGRRHGDRLYPGIAGVAQSYNYYPIHGMKPEDGMATVVLGLGRGVTDGEPSLWFSPLHPHVLPQFGTTDDYLRHTQRQFWAVDLAHPKTFAYLTGDSNLLRLNLDAAEEDGTLGPVGSVYMPDNDAVYDGISRAGVRLVTMAGVLKNNVFPLADIVNDVLEMGSGGMAAPVEIEFAANPLPDKAGRTDFAILQIRPLVMGREEVDLEDKLTDLSRVLIYSEQVLGNGVSSEISDIVVVTPETFDRSATPEVARQIGLLNQRLQDEGKPYLLVGPGRWGTRDRWLGIPVAWADISWARVIVETEMVDIQVEPSQGNHFFHNLTSFEVGYFTANTSDANASVNWEWLLSQPLEEETTFLRHVSLEQPLSVYIDGRRGRGAVLLSPDD